MGPPSLGRPEPHHRHWATPEPLMSTTLVAIFSQLRPISPASRRRRLPSPRPCLMLILSISSRCLPPQVWAGCPQLPAALHLGERLGDSAWPSYHLLVSTKAAARLPVGPAAASSLPPPGFLKDRPGLCLHALQWDLTSSFTWTRPYASSFL